MKEISLHVLDLANNALEAGATKKRSWATRPFMIRRPSGGSPRISGNRWKHCLEVKRCENTKRA
jgi:hypothetical protein